MIKKIKRILQDAKIALTIGMSNTDKQIMSGNFTKIPESAGIINPIYSRNSFLRGVQLGQLKEEELQRFYQVLDAMDHIHTRTKTEWIEVVAEVIDGNGQVVMEDGKPKMKMQLLPFAVPMSKEEIEAQDKATQLIGDPIEGYKTNLFVTNKDVLFVDATNLGFDTSLLTEKELAIYKRTARVYRPTVIIHRPDNPLKGGIIIENFASEIFVKQREDFNEQTDRDVILEFYCLNYNWRQKNYETENGVFQYDENDDIIDNFIPDLVYNKVTEGLNLKSFIDIEAVTLIQHTATRNDIVHNFEIESFLEIKKLDKIFVVKFNAKKF